ncbi:NitT/TauT family transport system ATP-binding protein [Caldalkalibacillus uzonensis]|uniref:NitT/TauT family transport system ATP-binding protein n=1 Tax=Caldalkalibacillus uzonensis TaxID=353224 RepID=A0ABU0CLY5_9BACI|nr:ABC transporter ATP-binding protein [Caldalkalibacillus uzonensis]MDQ0337431.1 NitT/TauT family transport system ATP-binding protein [Caldalkalibacillus uzonensis]
MEVVINDVSLCFQKEKPILKHVNAKIDSQEFVSMIGKSGSGKTSLLKMIAGLMRPTEGEIEIGGEKVDSPRDEVTYVFQKPVLLEWRTLLENVLLPYELQGHVQEEQLSRAKEILDLVGLSQDMDKYPHECSGGMLSRVALARALITEPKILLMDEPFAALDALTKEQMQHELERLSQQFKPTTIFITHDIQEAVLLSDRVFVLGERPARIVAEYAIPFDRPRHHELKFEPQFTQLVRELYQEIERGSAR